jgi:hypothetical protein
MSSKRSKLHVVVGTNPNLKRCDIFYSILVRQYKWGMKNEVSYNVTHLGFTSVGFYVKMWRESNV